MPRELVAISLRNPVLREYEEPELNPGEVRVKSLFSAPKHGSDLRTYRADTQDYTKPFDKERRVHAGTPQSPTFPMKLGNMTVGEIAEVDGEVTDFEVGDRVYGYLPIRETHTVAAQKLKRAPVGMPPEAIVYSDPAGVALGAIRESKLRIGDRVSVHGLGAIGQMALQLARIQGARWIAATDPIPLRCELANKHGADLVVNPVAQDAGVVIKDRTDTLGVDVALETSGNYAAMNDALRAAGYGGTIVSSAYYTGDSHGLSLEGEWHRNRLTIISSRDVSQPLRDHPLWDSKRIHQEAFTLLQEGRLSVEGLVHPIVPFDESAEAYREIDEAPARSIKLGIRYDV